MTSPTANAAFYADFSGLAELKRQSKTQSDTALRAAAEQFEALFTNMMLKTMREASFGDSLTDSQETQFYQGMFDQQLALQMSKGKGMGLADMLVEQLKRQGLVQQSPTAAGASTATRSAAPGSASTPSGSTTTSGTSASTQAAFVQQMLPYAQRASAALGVDASTLIAHAALETGWGQSLPSGASGGSHNLFGIKATGAWQGASATALTTEYENGVASARTARFKAYASPEDCFADYVSLLGHSRYAAACNSGSDVAQFAAGLQQGGYATDPLYAAKLQAVAGSVSKWMASAR